MNAIEFGHRQAGFDRADLEARGFAIIPKLLTPDVCQALAALYDAEGLFRSEVIMARHGFGRGRYKYFAYPLPELIGPLRTRLYGSLAEIANDWAERLGQSRPYPPDYADYLAQCHGAGQLRPTPLLLR